MHIFPVWWPKGKYFMMPMLGASVAAQAWAWFDTKNIVVNVERCVSGLHWSAHEGRARRGHRSAERRRRQQRGRDWRQVLQGATSQDGHGVRVEPR